MNATNIHLILNHVTIIGVPLAAIFLLHGILKGNLASRRFALIVLTVLAAVVIPVFLTGEPAEETVENLPGVVESMIETHEDAGKVSMIITVALGIISFLALLFQGDERNGRKFATIVLLVSVFSIGSLVYTGSLGGKIRHTEIRDGAEAAGIGPSTEKGIGEKDHDQGEHEENDDD